MRSETNRGFAEETERGMKSKKTGTRTWSPRMKKFVQRGHPARKQSVHAGKGMKGRLKPS
ncbi:MAG: hypothetical protein CW342_05280 [Thermoactinomycetaceae bacterium]|nr:hypothetical protein [Bacillota bacterium]MBO2532291.1 hypothetical protein [Thermoactinomycetaceae bacterium]